MITHDEQLSMENIGGGSVIEQANDAIQQILNNIRDVNTADGVRELNIKIQFKPNSDRGVIEITALCATKPAHAHSVRTMAICGTGLGGKAEAFEILSSQLSLPLVGNVVPIKNLKENTR